jgi:hypothetical protein
MAKRYDASLGVTARILSNVVGELYFTRSDIREANGHSQQEIVDRLDLRANWYYQAHRVSLSAYGSDTKSTNDTLRQRTKTYGFNTLYATNFARNLAFQLSLNYAKRTSDNDLDLALNEAEGVLNARLNWYYRKLVLSAEYEARKPFGDSAHTQTNHRVYFKVTRYIGTSGQ